MLKNKKLSNRLASLLLASIMIVSLGACGDSNKQSNETNSNSQPTEKTSSNNTDKPAENNIPAENTYDTEITIDAYIQSSNSQGIISGFGGKIWKDKFNVKINIIAPNISGQAIFQTRSAAGNLGDFIVMEQSNMRDVIAAGLAMDITDILAQRGTNFVPLQKNIDIMNNSIGVDKTYVIPIQMSDCSPLDPLANPAVGMMSYQDGAGSFMRWDLYKKVGMPPINTLEDLLDVIKLMKDEEPTAENGQPTFGFSIFKDWDGGAVHNVIGGFPQMYGYQQTPGTSSIITHADISDFKTQRLDDDNGLYYRSLKFYYQANQMGLLDPDSATQNWGTVVQKTKDGQVLFGLWPWSTMGQFNNADRGNLEEPIGYQFVPIADAQYFNKGFNPPSQWGAVIAIGSKAKEPERLMDILNWLATPEGMMTTTHGPKGMAWDVDENGNVYSTEFADKAALDPNILAPEEFGGGVFSESGAAFVQIFLPVQVNPDYGVPYDTRLWKATREKADTNLNRDWRNIMGAEHMIDYLDKHKMSAIAPGNMFLWPQTSPEMQSLRDICGTIVKNASWQMIYANDDAHFQSIWEDMKAQIKASNWDDIVAEDLTFAEAYMEACRETVRNAQ